MACDYQEATVRRESNALNRVLPVQIEELETLQLEIGAIIVICLEYFKNTFIITHSEIFSIWGKITTFCWMSQLDCVNEAVFPLKLSSHNKILVRVHSEELVHAN